MYIFSFPAHSKGLVLWLYKLNNVNSLFDWLLEPNKHSGLHPVTQKLLERKVHSLETTQLSSTIPGCLVSSDTYRRNTDF